MCSTCCFIFTCVRLSRADNIVISNAHPDEIMSDVIGNVNDQSSVGTIQPAIEDKFGIHNL